MHRSNTNYQCCWSFLDLMVPLMWEITVFVSKPVKFAIPELRSLCLALVLLCNAVVTLALD